jgi:hypothetical protein
VRIARGIKVESRKEGGVNESVVTPQELRRRKVGSEGRRCKFDGVTPSTGREQEVAQEVVAPQPTPGYQLYDRMSKSMSVRTSKSKCTSRINNSGSTPCTYI